MKASRTIQAVAALTVSLFATTAMAEQSAFYVVTNKADGNSIVGFEESKSGEYVRIGEFKTGGKGTGDLEIPALQKDETHPLANGDDPLISANAIAATKNGKFVVAVNPGDATIALLKVNSDRSLSAVNTAPATDKFPISVAIYGDMVVAASVGVDNNNGSIGAFKIKGGELIPVSESRRDLKARPSTIGFSSDGEHVIVNELVTGKIHTFAAAKGTLSKNPVSTIDSPRGNEERFQAIPVGFAVHGKGGDDILMMSEARFLTPEFSLREGNGEVVQSPLYSWQTGSLSTYKVSDDGMLSLVSGDVLTGSAVEGGEIANCWVVASADGKTLWAVNALSSSISTFDISKKGEAELRNITAYKDESEEKFFSDLALSRDGERLYQLVGNKGDVMIFDIEPNGDLTYRQSVSGLPTLGAYGLLVL